MRLGRLKSRADFLRVAGAARKCVRPGLVLQAAPQPPSHPDPRSSKRRPAQHEHEGDPRVGFTVTRKVGNAVERNRARRRLRAAVRQIMAQHALPGHDYVVIARRETLSRSFPDLLSDLAGALGKLGSPRRDNSGRGGRPG